MRVKTGHLGSRSTKYIYTHSSLRDGHGHEISADKMGWSCMFWVSMQQETLCHWNQLFLLTLQFWKLRGGNVVESVDPENMGLTVEINCQL